MSSKTTERTGPFTAHSEDGREFTVDISTEYEEGVADCGRPCKVAVRQELKTSDGEDVDRIEKGKYRVLGGFEELDIFSDDPDAP